jgi:hypothetical protein
MKCDENSFGIDFSIWPKVFLLALGQVRHAWVKMEDPSERPIFDPGMKNGHFVQVTGTVVWRCFAVT